VSEAVADEFVRNETAGQVFCDSRTSLGFYRMITHLSAKFLTQSLFFWII